jgi:2-polyprenyl-3-methyl-5-hydroxy-6-metoxy-1,4-benzoquinol methylase
VVGREGPISRDSGNGDPDALKVDNPFVVQWEYASEERLAVRNAVYRDLLTAGESADDVAFALVRELAPARVLEVGCGMGEFAQRVATELGVEVKAIDLSPRMVELARARGIDAEPGDVQQLQFADGEFDCVVANWVLYHVPDLDSALREIVRVLRPGGHLVATTVGVENMREVWDLVGGPISVERSFDARTGRDLLAAHFAAVEQRDVEGTLVFPDADAIKHFVSMTMTRAHLATSVPDLSAPLTTHSRHSIFVARR